MTASAETAPLTPGLRSTLLALALGTAGGWLANLLQLPLAWMIGAMTATTVAAVLGAPIAMPTVFRSAMVTVLGVMLGSGFSPEILSRIADWALSLAMLALYAAAAGAAGFVYFRRLCGYDPATAYFSAMPGGFAEMILAGSELGGDGRIISLTHASRVLLVVLALPFAVQALVGYEPGARPGAGMPLAEMGLADLGLLTACGIAGLFGARALKIPAAPLVGPMILSAAVHLAGWTAAKPPLELVAAAQVVVGSAIGGRFAGMDTGLIRRVVLGAAGGTAVLLGATIAFAVLLHPLTGLAIEALVLAFAPGGLAEMSLIAIALGADAAFVATHHIVRICLIVICAPMVFRLRRSLRGRDA
ncbi:MAG: AbrB family transcriptional regulator [Kiloniellaceae bacterium]